MTATPGIELADDLFLQYASLVREKSGLEVTPARRSDLERAVADLTARSALASPDQLYQLLGGQAGDPVLLDDLITRLTVGETHFFRNRPQFEALQNVILPELIEKRRAVLRLRLWSAGCASGEEAYSLAILLRLLLPDLARWNILILATDINRESLEKAVLGRYRPWSFREIPPDLKAAFFVSHGDRFEVAPTLRRMVTFRYLNLAEDSYPSLLTDTVGMDLIVCRNVLIYFNEEVNRLVARRFHETLAEAGWLVVGHAEPSQDIFRQFAVRNFPGTVVYQKSAVVEKYPAFSAPILPDVPAPAPLPPPARRPVKAAPAPEKPPARHFLKHLPAPVPAEIQTALRLFAVGQSAEAIQQLKALAEADPANLWPPYELARLYANLMELQAAETWIDSLLRREPLLAAAHYLRGLILQEAGRLEASLQSFRACIYADHEFVLGHFALAGVMARQNQPQRALKAFENVERLLVGRDPAEILPDGDLVTVGHLLEMTAAQKELLAG